MDMEQLQRKKLKVAEEECQESIKTWIKSKPGNCGSVWDGILCWKEASPDNIQTQPCPSYIHGFNKQENAIRYCDANGSWYVNPEFMTSWTNYSNCLHSDTNDTEGLISAQTVSPSVMQEAMEHGDRLQLISSIGYGVSLFSLVVAVIIICCSRKLKSKTNMLHLNLFLAFILRAGLSFLVRLLFVNGLGLEKDMTRGDDGKFVFREEGSHWECRLLQTVFMYAICVSMMWIFMEGLYLHMLIYKTISTDRNGVKLYTILGWVLPSLIIVPWVIVKYTTDNKYCWNYSARHTYIWIIKGPILATVLVNFIFFLNISRVLCSRVRSGERHMGSAYRRLAKFILVLVPLFGVFYIIINLMFPMSNTTRFNILHLYVEMTYNSFQGFLLALLFCFLNEEVLNAVKGLWRSRASKRDSGVTRSFVLSSFRRTSRHSGRFPPTTIYRRSSNSGEDVTSGWFSRFKRRALSWFGYNAFSNKNNNHASPYSSTSSKTKTGAEMSNQICDEEEILKCISSCNLHYNEETSHIT